MRIKALSHQVCFNRLLFGFYKHCAPSKPEKRWYREPNKIGGRREFGYHFSI